MAFWDDYGFHDFWSTSTVERVRNTYQDVIRDTEDTLATLWSDIASLQSMVNENVPKYRGSYVGDTSSGRFVTDVESGLDRWTVSLNLLIGVFSQNAMDLQVRLNLLYDRKAILDQMCADEDQRQEEYSLGDIPF